MPWLSTQVHLHVLMEVSVSTENSATAVDLMQADQDVRQVCRKKRAGLWDCMQVPTDARMTTLFLNVTSSSATFPTFSSL